MSTHNKLFEKLLNYLIKRRIILKTYATVYNKQLTLTFGGLGFLKKMNKGHMYIYIYEDRKENIPVMG